MVAALTSFVTSALPALNAAAAAAPAGSTAVDDVASFIKYLSDTTAAGLQSTRETTFIGGYVQLLGALSRVEPKLFSEHVAPLSKLLQRLVRDPAATRATAGASAGQSGTANREGADGASSREPDMPLKTLKLVVELVCAYASSHTDDVDARRGFAIPLIQLIDPKVDHDLLLKVTKLITPWLTAPLSQTTMTVKERAQFVMKMTVFESVPYPPLQAAFLDIVYKMYTDAQLARRELLDKIEPAFMFGLRARDVSLRSSFYDIFHRSVGRTPYHRLHFLVQTQDADALASTTWLRHALQLLLATAELDASIVLPSSGPQLPTLLLKPAPTTSTGDAPASASATSWHAVLKAHTSFLSSCASCGTNGELLATLAELLHDEKAVPIMYGLWVSLLPQVWAQLSSTEQEQMVKPIVTVLSKESPHRQSSSKPNTVQAWLHALSACKPMPKLPASLLKYLARAYGAWHLVWPMLQHQALHFPTEPQWYDALSELSSQLHDRDLYCALWAKRAAHPETRRALALEQYGAWHAAQAAYVECMHRWQSGDVALINTPRAELMQWEHGLIRAAKNLNQWELLTEFAKSMPAAQPTLLMECLWKIGDWERLKDLFAKYSLPEQPRIKMLQTYAAIHEGKLPDAEQRCNEGIQAALLQWTSLPSLDAATHTPLLQIFQQFQELQESAQMLLEISNAQRAQAAPDLSSILTTWRERLPNRWEDLPAWNDLVSWRNHMFSHINNVLTRVSSDNPQVTSAAMQELIWTNTRFAHVARRQSLPEACVNIIAKIQTVASGIPSADLNDAFAKLREQARACLQLPNHATSGLELLQRTDIKHLSAAQKSDIYLTKAELLLAIAEQTDGGQDTHELDDASSALATSIYMHTAQPKAWLLWGRWCDAKAKGSADQDGSPTITLGQGDPEDGAEKRSSGSASWSERALACYMQAALHRREQAASMLPRVLEIMRDAPTAERVQLAKVFGDHCDGVPLWEWLPWLPQLLDALRGVEGPQVQHVLLRVTKAYPQAIFYPLRAFLTDGPQGTTPPETWTPTPSTAVAAANSGTSSGPTTAAAATTDATAGTSGSVVGSAADDMVKQEVGASTTTTDGMLVTSDTTRDVPSAAEVAMPDADASTTTKATASSAAPAIIGLAGKIKAHFAHEHPQLYAQLCAACDAIARHLGPRPMERLLLAICDLLTLALSQPPGTNLIPPSLRAALDAFGDAFSIKTTAIDADAMDVDSAASADNLSTHIRNDLAREFFTNDAPASLSELLTSLTGWRSRIEAALAADQPWDDAMLETDCWQLVHLQQPLMEVPAQYSDERTPALDQHALIERFDADVAVHRDGATGETTRLVSLRADDGSRHTFAVCGAGIFRAHAPLALERVGQLARLLNSKLLRAREARRRALMIHVPASVRLGGGFSLVSSSSATPRLSLAAALVVQRNDAGLPPHAPILAHQRALVRGATTEEASARRVRLRDAFLEACNAVPEDALSRVIHARAPSASVLWEVQRRLSSQLGLHALLTYALKMRTTTPDTLILRRDSGSAEFIDFGPLAPGSSTPVIAADDAAETAIPFRLTRTLQQFITPLGIDGPYSGAMCAAAECLSNRSKCALPLWLDALARPEGGSTAAREDTAAAGLAAGLVPWGASGDAAAERMRELSPVLVARGASTKGPAVDVHAKVRMLVEAATSQDNLAAMPSAFQAWL